MVCALVASALKPLLRFPRETHATKFPIGHFLWKPLTLSCRSLTNYITNGSKASNRRRCVRDDRVRDPPLPCPFGTPHINPDTDTGGVTSTPRLLFHYGRSLGTGIQLSDNENLEPCCVTRWSLEWCIYRPQWQDRGEIKRERAAPHLMQPDNKGATPTSLQPASSPTSSLETKCLTLTWSIAGWVIPACTFRSSAWEGGLRESTSYFPPF